MIKNSDDKVFMVLALLSLVGCVLLAVFVGVNMSFVIAADFFAMIFALPAIGCLIAILIKLFRKIDMTYYLKAYLSSWGLFLVFALLYVFNSLAGGTFLFLLVAFIIQFIFVIIQSAYFAVKYRGADVWFVLFLSNPALHLLINLGGIMAWLYFVVSKM